MANWIRADIKRGKKRSTQVFAHRGKLIVEKLLGYLDESINDDWLTRIFSPRLTKSFLIVPTFANEYIIYHLLYHIHRIFFLRCRKSSIDDSRNGSATTGGENRGNSQGWLRKETSFEEEENLDSLVHIFPFFSLILPFP